MWDVFRSHVEGLDGIFSTALQQRDQSLDKQLFGVPDECDIRGNVERNVLGGIDGWTVV